VPIPNDSKYTILDNDLAAIIYDTRNNVNISFATGQRIPDTETLDVRAISIKPQLKSITHCIIALIEGTPTDVKNYCKFTVGLAPLPPQLVRLSASEVFLSNIPRIDIICNSSTTSLTLAQRQSLYTIHTLSLYFARNALNRS
jgi:hypothetical protein